MFDLSSNMPYTIFYESIFSELLRRAECILTINDFISSASDLVLRIIAQDGDRAAVTKQLKKAFHRYPNVFQKFGKFEENLVVKKSKSISIELS